MRTQNPFVAEAALLLALLAAAGPVSAMEPVPLSEAEAALVGVWQRTDRDGLTECLALRSDRTALAWGESAAGRTWERLFVHWELDEPGSPRGTEMLLVEQVSDGALSLIDATWSPAEAIRVVGGALIKGAGSEAHMTRAPEGRIAL